MAWRSHRECPLVVLEVTPPRVQRILRRAQHTPPRVRRTRPRAQRTRPRVQPTRPRVQRTRPRVRHIRPRVRHTPQRVRHTPQRVQRTRQRITRQRKKTKTTSKSKARGARLFSSNPEITSPHAYQTPIHFHPSIIARTGIDGDGGDVRLHAQSPSALAQKISATTSFRRHTRCPAYKIVTAGTLSHLVFLILNALFDYNFERDTCVMSSGRTHSSNCSPVSNPSATPASRSVVPSACAFLEILAAAS